MREWLNRAVSKTVEALRPPWVRIPPSPPQYISPLFQQLVILGVGLGRREGAETRLIAPRSAPDVAGFKGRNGLRVGDGRGAGVLERSSSRRAPTACWVLHPGVCVVQSGKLPILSYLQGDIVIAHCLPPET